MTYVNDNNSMALKKGTIVGTNYEIISVLGEGGFGITYLAFDNILRINIAIKEYFPFEIVSRDISFGNNDVCVDGDIDIYQKGLKKFYEEAHKIAIFSKEKNIVSFNNFFYENNTAYIVMEYVNGDNISTCVKNKGVFSHNDVKSIMMPILDALEKVHNGGIIHRDISPDNIICGENNEGKLIDFGSAKYIDIFDQKSVSITLKHGYAPPEQYENGKLGPWSDVYSLCATMYYMLTNIKPQESIERQLEGDKLVHISKINKNLPKSLANAIMKGLSLNTNNRQQNIKELKNDINKKDIFSNAYKKQMIIGSIAFGVCVILISSFFIYRNIEKKHSSDEYKKKKLIEKVQKTIDDDEVIIESSIDYDYNYIKLNNRVEEQIQATLQNDFTNSLLEGMDEEESGDATLDLDKNKDNPKNISDELSNFYTTNTIIRQSSYNDFDGNGKKELFCITGKKPTKVPRGYENIAFYNLKIWLATEDGVKLVCDYDEVEKKNFKPEVLSKYQFCDCKTYEDLQKIHKQYGFVFQNFYAQMGSVKHYFLSDINPLCSYGEVFDKNTDLDYEKYYTSLGCYYEDNECGYLGINFPCIIKKNSIFDEDADDILEEKDIIVDDNYYKFCLKYGNALNVDEAKNNRIEKEGMYSLIDTSNIIDSSPIDICYKNKKYYESASTEITYQDFMKFSNAVQIRNKMIEKLNEEIEFLLSPETDLSLNMEQKKTNNKVPTTVKKNILDGTILYHSDNKIKYNFFIEFDDFDKLSNDIKENLQLFPLEYSENGKKAMTFYFEIEINDGKLVEDVAYPISGKALESYTNLEKNVVDFPY